MTTRSFLKKKILIFFQDNQTDQENDGELIYIITNELANNISFPSIWRGLYKTELIRNIRFISGRNNQDFLWSANALLKVGKVARVDKVLYGWRKRPGSETEVGIRRRLLDYLEAKRLTVETIKESAPEWTVPYTVAMFASCLNAAGRLPQLSDPFERKKYQEEINKALNYFSQISILDILMDPYSKRRRKLITVIGKISFPLACSLKKKFLKIVDR